jgi:hypothetical protein
MPKRAEIDRKATETAKKPAVNPLINQPKQQKTGCQSAKNDPKMRQFCDRAQTTGCTVAAGQTGKNRPYILLRAS